MQRVTLFYSWQSDRPTELCKNFIAKALDIAAGILTVRDGIELVIDMDTRNVPGTPPVTDTILEKIRACDIFLADMTYVAVTDDPEEPQGVPNPNAMIEYGYALSQRGSKRILLTMNDAFGEPKNLPFNVKHLRWPSRFSVPEGMSDGARREARAGYGADLADYVRDIALDMKVSPSTRDDTKARLQTVWWEAVCNRPSFRNLPVVISQPSVVVHVTPKATALDSAHLDPAAVDAARRLLRRPGEFKQEANAAQWWAHGPERRVVAPNPETDWVTRFFRPGIVEWDLNLGHVVNGDESVLVHLDRVEELIVEVVDRSLVFLDELELAGPCLASVLLYGMDVADIPLPRQLSRRFPQPSFICPTALIPAGEQRSADHLKAIFDSVWMEAGRSLGSPTFREGRWTGYAQPDA